MNIARTAVGTALTLLAALGAALVADTRFALAGAGKSTFDCSSLGACVTATNQGAGAGLTSTSASGNGISAYTKSSVASGVYGENDSSAGGTGVEGHTLGNSGTVAFQADGGQKGATPLYLTQSFSGFSYTFLGVNNGNPVLVAGNTGNLTISGLLYSFVSCYFGCSRTRRVVMYGANASQPTLHDGGEAMLRDGVTSVPLDAAVRRAIDGLHYVVFVTPEGPTKGLYVARRTASGFVVREVHGGRGSARFAYRIIAHPYGVIASRFPVTNGVLGAEGSAKFSR